VSDQRCSAGEDDGTGDAQQGNYSLLTSTNVIESAFSILEKVCAKG
jgi:hypothetical protein